jgi:hypothetical protein
MMFVVSCFENNMSNICVLPMGNHEPWNKWIALEPQNVGVNAILCIMLKIEEAIVSCSLVKAT